MVAMVAPSVQGQTTQELLAQIQQLQQQLAQLMQQYQQLAGQQPAGQVPAACAGITFNRNLSQGMSGNDVKCLQAILNQSTDTQVAASGPGSPGNETTYFGSLTKSAVIKFQNKYASEILTPVGLTAGTGYVGSKTRAKLNALLTTGVQPPAGCTTDADCPSGQVCQSGTCVTPSQPTFEAMTVKLAADNPAGANIQRGTPNNAVLKITLYGDTTNIVNVSGITLKQYGNIDDNYITAVRLWDESGVQLGSDRTVIGGNVSFVIVPTLSIPAKGSRTLKVTVDASSSADIMTTVQLGVDAASSITGASFTGTFPVKGNTFTIVPAGQYGSLSVAGYGSLPKYSVKIGEKDIVLNRFIVSAGAREDVKLIQVSLEGSANHTAVDSDISNIRIRQVGGAVVGGPITLSSKKATINLATPVTIAKGTSKQFEVIGDIAAGNGRNIDLTVPYNKVIGLGVTSGVSIVATGSTADFSTISIGIGTLTVNQSASHPVGTAAAFVKTTNAKNLGVFSVKATGEDILVNQVVLTFSNVSSTNYLTSVGLYDGDSLISDLKDSVTGTGNQTFTLNYTIPANTTKDITVKASTYNISTQTSLTITWVGGNNGYGLSSGESISTSGNTSLSAVTIYPSGTISTAILDVTKAPYNQGLLAPLSNVSLVGLKVMVTREDMKLYSLALSGKIGETTSSDAIASVALYAEDGTTQLSNSVNVSSGTFTITEEDLIQEILFPKNTYKTLIIKGRSSATTTDLYTLSIATSSLVLMGQDSSATTSNSSPISLYNTSQGQFMISDVVIEMKKNAESPSGNVSRGSLETYAIWDVTNPTNQSVSISSITFTSKTGLPSDVGTTTSYFKLYDELGNNWSASSASSSAGTVTFSSISGLSLSANQTKQLYLKINTTDSNVWPAGTQMHWTVNAYSDVTLSTGYVGNAGTTWSIKADTNVVKL
jgi:Cys-rich repeat protein